jgi:MerR family transcriptional regulator, light-induced transcriptional regulator
VYTIKKVAELTGVSAATLRAWERRYEIVSPRRTEAGYRLYDEAAVGLITQMNGLVQQGWTASQAALEARRRTAGQPAPRARRGRADQRPRHQGQPPPRRDDSAFTEPPPSGLADLGALIPPAANLDAIALSDVLDGAFSRASFETVCDRWLMPALHALGDAWADGSVTVAGEHLVSYAVQRRLAAAFDAAARRSDGPRVIIGLPPGARHELGLLAFAVAARRAGLTTDYVGADLPTDEWAGAVSRHEPSAAVLAASNRAEAKALLTVEAELVHARPDLVLAVGGTAQELAPGRWLRLGHEIGPAARTLADALAGAASD